MTDAERAALAPIVRELATAADESTPPSPTSRPRPTRPGSVAGRAAGVPSGADAPAGADTPPTPPSGPAPAPAGRAGAEAEVDATSGTSLGGRKPATPEATDEAGSDAAESTTKTRKKPRRNPQETRRVSEGESAASTEDAGAELWYNRRNRTGAGLRWDDIADLNPTLKVKETVKSKIWPRPDYEALVNDGLHPVLARVVKDIYDKVAVKPQVRGAPTDAQLQDYTDSIQRLREATFDWVRTLDTPAFRTALAQNDGVALSRRLVDYPLLNTLFPGERHRRFTGNKENNERAWLLGGRRLVSALQVGMADLRAAVRAVNGGWPAPQEAWERSYTVREIPVGGRVFRNGQRETTTAPEFMVIRKRSSTVEASGFATRAEAVDAARELARRTRTGGGQDTEEAISLADAVRTGVAHRAPDENITSKRMIDTFGFRGVNFGNWMKGRGNTRERQLHLNHAYDSFADLADVLGVPPRAISLNGMLGVAFGAQGSGGKSAAAAHFVPGVNEINLTRNSGVGSLAHEWGHALDHYFAVQAGDRYAKASEPFMTHLLDGRGKIESDSIRPEIVEAFRSLVKTMQERPATPEEVADTMRLVRSVDLRRVNSWLTPIRERLEDAAKPSERERALIDFDALAERVRAGDLGDRIVMVGRRAYSPTVAELHRLIKDATGRMPDAELMQGLQINARLLARTTSDRAGAQVHLPQNAPTRYLQEAEKLDASADTRRNAGYYWRQPTELLARAFQSYTLDRLAEREARNDYLTRPQWDEQTTRAAIDMGLLSGDRYPRGPEREAINATFDRLIGALQTREEGGNVALFSRPEPEARAGWVDTAHLDRAVRTVMSQWRGDIPVVRTVTLADELPAAAKVGRGWKTAEGWYDGGNTIYLVAGNIPNVSRGLQVLAHEALGHYGIEAVLGKAQWTQVVGDIARLRRRRESLSGDMRAAMDSAVRRYGDESAATFAREFLAIAAERNVRSSLVARVLAAVRRWLRSMGWPLDAWAADEIRAIVAAGAKQVTRRKRQRQQGDRRGAAFADRTSPFFSALVEAVERAQGAPRRGSAAQWKGWLDGAQRRGEFKQAERDWLELDRWLNQQEGPIDRATIADYVRANQVRIEEVTLGGPMEDLPAGWSVVENEDGDGFEVLDAQGIMRGEGDTRDAAIDDAQDRDERTSDNTKFRAYTLPGGENYRELLLTLPGRQKLPDGASIRRVGSGYQAVDASGNAYGIPRATEELAIQDMGEETSQHYRSSHFPDTPNILTHVRFNERTDAHGKRVLFLEEIQSDWHQAGRRRGYQNQLPQVTKVDIAPYWLAGDMRQEWLVTYPNGESREIAFPATLTADQVAREARKEDEAGVPDAPLKGTDEWAMLAFKRMVRHAAENGFDRIAWTTGDMQASRYDLSTQVSAVEARPLGNDDFEITIVDRNGNEGMAGNRTWAASELPDLVGKELADKIVVDTAGGRRKRYSGLDLKVGGSGMRAFYDQILPKAVNRWAKKMGGRVGRTSIISNVSPQKDLGNAEVEAVTAFHDISGSFWNTLSRQQQNELTREYLEDRGRPEPTSVHALDLTDAMREVALSGLPMFSRPEPEWAVLDTRGKVLGRAPTELEAERMAARLRNAGKRVQQVQRVGAAPRVDPAVVVERVDPDTGSRFQEIPALRKAVDTATQDGDLSALLDSTAKALADDPAFGVDYVWLAKKLSPMVKKLGVKLVKPPKNLDYAGAYRVGDNTVWIRQALPHVILHESLHAVTSATMTSPSLRRGNAAVRKAVNEFNDLLAAAQAHAATLDMSTLTPELRRLLQDKQGPLSNIKELLAYGMTERPFQRWLNTIPAPIGRETPRSAWQWFKDAVGRLLTPRGERLEGPRNTLLGAVIETGSDLVNFAADNPGAVRMAQFTEAARQTTDPAALSGIVAAADRITGRPRHAIPERFDAEQAAAAEKFVTFQRREKFSTRVERVKDQAGKRLVQRVFDQFRPLRDLDETAFMQAHLSKATDGALEAAFEHGIPVLRQGAFDIDERTGGFKKVLADLSGEHDQFLMWVVGNRAEALAGEGRERLFSAADIAAMKRLNEGTMADGRSRKAAYTSALRELQRYNKAMLDIGEKAGLIDPEGRKIWESEFYIPFYRVMEDDSTNGPGQIKGLLRQQVIKRLRGGTEPLGDPLENLLANWSHMLTGSMRNLAATRALDVAVKAGIADEVSSQQKGAVWAMRGGQKAWYLVHDPMVLESLESLSFNGFNNPVMRAAGKFKRVLTQTVTINPSFRIRNLARDVLSAMATADVGYNPVANVVNGMKVMSIDNGAGVALLAGGGRIRFGTINDGQQAQHAKRLIEAGVKGQNILDTRAKMLGMLRRSFDWWQEVGDKVETVNRALIYERAIKAGKTHLQASYEARDLMNFTSMGSSSIVRALAQVLPFFNARLQGLDRLGRGARRDPTRFYAVTGTLALASAALHLLQSDDDDYKALPDYVRDTYWPVKIGGQFYYIPKPFEVGAMATVVERATELAVSGGDYQAKDFGATVLEIAMSQLAMNPIPQIARPVTEAAFNYDLYRMAPIDSMGQQKLLPEDRFTARTRAGAVAAGQLTGMSPQRLEHMVRGYFGWIGTQALNVSDYLLRDAIGLPSSPQRDLSRPSNLFVVGDFVKDPDAISNKYVTRFYDQMKDIDRIYASVNLARRTGDTVRAQALASSPQMAARPLYANANKQISKINRQIRTITAHPTLSPAEKNKRLDLLNRRRSEIAMRVDAAARARQ